MLGSADSAVGTRFGSGEAAGSEQAVEFTGDDEVNLPLGNYNRAQPFSVSLWLKTPDVKDLGKETYGETCLEETPMRVQV